MPYKNINKPEALHLLDETHAVLVDIRDIESFKAGHVANAFHLTQETLPLFFSGTAKDIPVLVMCYHGNSSRLAAEFLNQQGFDNVYSIIGGYEAWGEE